MEHPYEADTVFNSWQLGGIMKHLNYKVLNSTTRSRIVLIRPHTCREAIVATLCQVCNATVKRSRLLDLFIFIDKSINNKATNKQLCSCFLIKVCLYLYTYVCQSFETDGFLSNNWLTKTTVFFNVHFIRYYKIHCLPIQ